MYFLMVHAYHTALHARQFSLHHPQKYIEAVTYENNLAELNGNSV